MSGFDPAGARASVLRAFSDAGVLDGQLTVSREQAMLAAARCAWFGVRVAERLFRGERHCSVCGCTQTTACLTDEAGYQVPCGWADADLCTACAPFMEGGE